MPGTICFLFFVLDLFFDHVENYSWYANVSNPNILSRWCDAQVVVVLGGGGLCLVLCSFLPSLHLSHSCIPSPPRSLTEQHWLNAPCSPFSLCWNSAAWSCRYHSAALWQTQTEVCSFHLTAIWIAATSQSCQETCWHATAANKLITPVSHRFWSQFPQNYN